MRAGSRTALPTQAHGFPFSWRRCRARVRTQVKVERKADRLRCASGVRSSPMSIASCHGPSFPIVVECRGGVSPTKAGAPIFPTAPGANGKVGPLPCICFHGSLCKVAKSMPQSVMFFTCSHRGIGPSRIYIHQFRDLPKWWLSFWFP